MSIKLLTGKIALISLVLTSPAFGIKTGYVSMNRLIQTSSEGKEALQGLQKIIDQKQADLAEKRKGIEKMFREWEERQALLSDAAKKTEERKFQEKVQRQAMEMKQAEMLIAEELQNRQREIAERMKLKLEDMLTKSGKGEEIDLIVDPDTGAVLYTKNAVSLTDSMIDQYNKSFKLANKDG